MRLSHVLFRILVAALVFIGAGRGARAAVCADGYYWNGSACLDCGAAYFCNNNNKYSCLDYVASSFGLASVTTIVNGVWDAKNAWDVSQCVCDWHFSDLPARTKYQNEAKCTAGPTGNNYTRYEWCSVGYYATDPLNWGNWYTNCAACTNKPANSQYTGYGTPSVMYAVESNCPWICDSGFYRSGNSCIACPTRSPGVAYGNIIYNGQAQIYGSDGTRESMNDCYLTGPEAWDGLGWSWPVTGTCHWNGTEYWNCTRNYSWCIEGYYRTDPVVPLFANSCQPCPAGSVTANGNNGNGGNPHGLTGARYGNSTSCTCVGNDYWAGAGSATRNACLANTKSGGCGWGAAASTDCTPYKTLRNSRTSNAPILRTVRTAPAGRNLCVDVEGTVYCGNLTETPIAGAIKLNVNGTILYVTDNATQ